MTFTPDSPGDRARQVYGVERDREERLGAARRLQGALQGVDRPGEGGLAAAGGNRHICLLLLSAPPAEGHQRELSWAAQGMLPE